jgi:hypothetical protein
MLGEVGFGKCEEFWGIAIIGVAALLLMQPTETCEVKESLGKVSYSNTPARIRLRWASGSRSTA